jgi:phospholipid/cholesterol/gamma-HCH transport system substrate-binding protein
MDYKKMSYISGVIIFAGFVIVLVSIIWLSTESVFFSHDYSIYVKFPEVTGLRDQSPVLMRGYRVGKTKGVKFEPDGIVIQVNINKKYEVPRGSRFEVTTINLIGEKAISIVPLDTSREVIRPGDIVRGENKDIMIVAQSVLSSMKKQIEGHDISDRIKRLGESVDLLHSILIDLDKKLDQVDVADISLQVRRVGEAAQQIQGFAKAAQPDAVELTKEGREVLGKMKGAIDRFTSLSTGLDTLVAKINGGEGTAGELVNNKEYITNLNATVTEMRLLIQDIKANPKRYLKMSLF